MAYKQQTQIEARSEVLWRTRESSHPGMGDHEFKPRHISIDIVQVNWLVFKSERAGIDFSLFPLF